MDDLELVDTPDLVAELQRRYDAGVIFLTKTITLDEEQTYSRHWGGSHAIGCAVAMRRKVIRDWERTAMNPGLDSF